MGVLLFKSVSDFLRIVEQLDVVYDVHRGTWFIAKGAGPQMSLHMCAGFRRPESGLLLVKMLVLGCSTWIVLKEIYYD